MQSDSIIDKIKKLEKHVLALEGTPTTRKMIQGKIQAYCENFIQNLKKG